MSILILQQNIPINNFTYLQILSYSHCTLLDILEETRLYWICEIHCIYEYRFLEISYLTPSALLLFYFRWKEYKQSNRVRMLKRYKTIYSSCHLTDLISRSYILKSAYSLVIILNMIILFLENYNYTELHGNIMLMKMTGHYRDVTQNGKEV